MVSATSRSGILKRGSSVLGRSLHLIMDRSSITDNIWIFFLILFLTILLRIPTLFMPISYDEGLFISIGKFMYDGFLLYSEIGDTKPPMIYLLHLTLYSLVGNSLIYYRLFALLCIVISLISMYFVCTRIWGQSIGFIACFLYSVNIVSLSHDYALKPDLLNLPIFIWSFYLMYHGFRTSRELFVFGFLVGLSFMITQSVIIIILLLFLALYSAHTGILKSFIPVLSAGFIISVFPFIIYLWFNNSLWDAFYNIFLFHLYRDSLTTGLINGFFSKIDIFYNIYFTSPFTYLTGLSYFFYNVFRKRFSLIEAWFVISVFYALFLLPHLWIHYMILQFPIL